MALDSCVGPQTSMLGHGDACNEPENAVGRGGGGMAVLWRACREAEADKKRLEVELRAEKEARAAERAGLLARLHIAQNDPAPAMQPRTSSGNAAAGVEVARREQAVQAEIMEEVA